MKFTALVSAAVIGSAMAAPSSTIKSKPFRLVLTDAEDKSLNGQVVVPCHEGALVDALCIEKPIKDDSRDVFRQVTQKGSEESVSGAGIPGLITFGEAAGGSTVSLNLQLNFRLSTDLGHFQFYPDGEQGQYAAFDKKNLMNLQDRFAGKEKAFYRWYVCGESADPYGWPSTLNWGMGSSKPEDASCKKVQVKRVFV